MTRINIDIANAIEKNQMDKVKKYIDNSTANGTFERDWDYHCYEIVSLLQFAAELNRVEAIKLLMKHGAIVHFLPNGDQTPMSICIERNFADALRAMILGAKKKSQLPEHIWEHAFKQAFFSQDESMVLILVQNNTLHNKWHWPDTYVLHRAVQCNMQSVVEYIMEVAPEELLVPNYEKIPSWCVAASLNDFTLLNMILSHELVQQVDKTGDFAIGYYMQSKHIDIDRIQLLMGLGFSLLATSPTKETVLHYIQNTVQAKFVYQYVKHHFAIDVENEFGETPFMFAAMHGNLEALRFLHNHGAKVNKEQPVTRRNALAYAVEHDQLDSVRFLIEHECRTNTMFVPKVERPNFYPEKFAYPLLYATYYKNADIVNALLCDENAKAVTNSNGSTAYAYANAEIRRDLHTHGCKWTIAANDTERVLRDMLQRDNECDMLEAWMEYGMLGNPFKCKSNKTTPKMANILLTNVNRVELIDGQKKQTVVFMYVSTIERLLQNAAQRNFGSIELVLPKNKRIGITTQASWKHFTSATTTVQCIGIPKTLYYNWQKTKYRADIKFFIN